ncbi:MAG: PspC domain-containing protein [Streptosporangiaceae bacterium]
MVRAVTAILCLIGGTGGLAYAAAWIIIPAEGETSSIAQNIVSKKPSG